MNSFDSFQYRFHAVEYIVKISLFPSCMAFAYSVIDSPADVVLEN
jgi:hypothetical protein